MTKGTTKPVDLGSLQDHYNKSVADRMMRKQLLLKAQAALDAAKEHYGKAEEQYAKAKETLANALRTVIY